MLLKFEILWGRMQRAH